MPGKKKISPTALLLPAALLATGLLAAYFRQYDWEEHYLPDKKDPYGLYVLKSLLQERQPRFRTVEQGLETPTDRDAVYVFVGNRFPLDATAAAEWLSFVRAGNQAFVACNQFPTFLMDSLLPPPAHGPDEGETRNSYADALSTGGYPSEDTARLNFLHPDMSRRDDWKICFRDQQNTLEYDWKTLPDSPDRTGNPRLLPLGTLQHGQPNFGRISYGRGVVYLHTTPLAFTNLHLKTSEGLAYAERVFSHFPMQRIYWEERRHSPSPVASDIPPQAETPLKYILSKPSLAWAWYILASLALLFILFRAKRRQRIVPVLERPENTSLAFIRTIGRLSFLQGNHRQAARQQMKFFLGFLREKYGLHTGDLDEHFVETLAARSGISASSIRRILTLHRNISDSGSVSTQTLVDFHGLLTHFRENCQ
ncbi:MAG: hypothetical protein RLY31_1608 [Bacteroidota bacterium]